MIETFQQRTKRAHKNLKCDLPPLAQSLEEEIARMITLYKQAGEPYGTSADMYEMYDKVLLWLAEMRGLSVVWSLANILLEVVHAANNEHRGLSQYEIDFVEKQMLQTFAKLAECYTGGSADG